MQVKRIYLEKLFGVEALPIAKRIELIDKKKFTAVGLDINAKILLLQVAALWPTPIHLNIKVLIGAFLANKAPMKKPAEYSEYADIFQPNIAMESPEHTSDNNHGLNLMKDKSLPYNLIYSLDLEKLETMKTYIKTYLKKEFIRLFQPLADTPILFD